LAGNRYHSIDRLAVVSTSEIYDNPYAVAEEFIRDLDIELETLRALLIEKNQSYGDSALNPVRIFSKAEPTEQLRIRIDDKLSRIMRSGNTTEDTLTDLLGYLVLLRIAERRA
jgi:hypothetical protein